MRHDYYLRDLNRWPLPIESVPDCLNPFVFDGVKLYIASTSEFRFGSHKLLTVLGMWQGAIKRGVLNKKNVHTVLTASSGNTAWPVATIAHAEDYKVKLIIKSDLPAGKRYPLDLTNAQIIPPEEKTSPIITARNMGGGGWREEGWHADNGHLDLDQYGNMDGTDLHATFLTEKILAFFAPKELAAITVSIGTGGMATGLRAGVRRLSMGTQIWGTLCSLGHEIPGCRDRKGMKDITLPWEASLHGSPAEIPMRPSYLASLWLYWTLGLGFGPSTGLAYLGALQKIQRHKVAGTLESLRDRHEEILVLIVGSDDNRAYGDRYHANLPAEFLKVATAPLPWEFPGDKLW